MLFTRLIKLFGVCDNFFIVFTAQSNIHVKFSIANKTSVNTLTTHMQIV